MKTFVRILSVLAMIFFVACSENIYLHDGDDGLDGQNGLNGQDGKDGQNGYSVSIFLDTLTNVKISYWDINFDDIPNTGDSILFEEPREGIRLTQSGNCVEISEIVGTEAIDSFLVCNGEDGETGPQGEPGIPGQDGEDGQNGKTIFVYPSFTEDCNNSGNSPYYRGIGWFVRFTEYLGIYSFNSIYAPNGNGTMVLDDYTTEKLDTIWSPEFPEPTAIDYFSCDIGSKGVYELKLVFLHQDKKVTDEGSIKTIPVTNFVWYDNLTYQQKFVYQVEINDIQFQDVVRFGLVVIKVGDFTIPESDWRNGTFNADNFFAHRIKIIQ